MVGHSVKDVLLRKFKELYGRDPEVVAHAPGRVEILGNHTDYNEGLVLSAATQLGTCFAVSARADSTARLTAGDIMETVEFPVAAPEPGREHFWSNYVKGVVAGLNAIKPPATGFDAAFLGDIPLGAGLSSSAALEMSAALALAKLYGLDVPRIELARIGQMAEHEFAGVRCGLMDQITSLFGEAGALVKSDFRSLEIETAPLPGDVAFLMCDTGVSHELADGDYNERREACEAAVAYFAGVLPKEVRALRDVTWSEWQKNRAGLHETHARRAAHPIGENERVRAGVEMLRNRDIAGFGKLMFESHESSRRYFENSCAELDALVDAASATPGALGARLSGGGFGGSVVVLVKPEDADSVANSLRSVYARKFGERCDTRLITCSAGARLMRD